MGHIDITPLKGFTARYRAWSPEEEAAAKAMRADGKTLAAIGEALDRSLTSVEACLRRLEDRRSRPLKTKKEGNRLCLCCGKKFASAGPQNRLCMTCRKKDISPYALF